MSALAVNIASVNDLLRMTPEQLTRQANVLLYGSPDILEEAEQRQIFYRLYTPRNLNTPLIYAVPKSDLWMSSRLKALCVCIDCGRPRHYLSGSRCRYCYILTARLKFYEASQGAAWLEEQAKGVVMPKTEWWDDTDLPAQPTRIAKVEWNADRLDWARAA